MGLRGGVGGPTGVYTFYCTVGLNCVVCGPMYVLKVVVIDLN